MNKTKNMDSVFI